MFHITVQYRVTTRVNESTVGTVDCQLSSQLYTLRRHGDDRGLSITASNSKNESQSDEKHDVENAEPIGDVASASPKLSATLI